MDQALKALKEKIQIYSKIYEKDPKVKKMHEQLEHQTTKVRRIRNTRDCAIQSCKMSYTYGSSHKTTAGKKGFYKLPECQKQKNEWIKACGNSLDMKRIETNSLKRLEKSLTTTPSKKLEGGATEEHLKR